MATFIQGIGQVYAPTPDTPVPIQSVTGLQNVEVCGKNLFDKDNVNTINGYFTGSGETTITGHNSHRIIYIPCNPNTTYTVQKLNEGSNKRFGLATSETIPTINGTIMQSTGQQNNQDSLTITTNSTANYLLVWCYVTNDEQVTWQQILDSIQIEQGSTATTYEPYKGNTYEVNLGKNLFNLTSINDYDSGVASLNNNIITLNWSAGYNLDINDALSNLDSTKTYTISFKHKGNAIYLRNNSAGTTNILYTSNDSEYALYSITLTNITSFQFRFVRKDTTGTAYIKDFQIEAGSVATSYSEYFTPIELNKIGDYKDSIKKSTGKNLFDGIVAQGEFNILGNINATTIRNYSVNYIPVIPNENYVSNYNINRMCFYDKNKTFINRSSNYNFATFTIPSNAYYIRFDISTDYNASTMQIEKGSTATTYEPYGKVWYVEKQIGKVVLNGSNEGWGLVSTYTNNTRFVSSTLILSKITNLMSNYFVEGQGGTDTPNIDTNGTTGQLMITIPTSIASTHSQFITWLSTNKPEILYQLDTPEITEITNTELIEDLETLYTAKSQEGTTNISITSEDLEMILNVSALKGDA